MTDAIHLAARFPRIALLAVLAALLPLPVSGCEERSEQALVMPTGGDKEHGAQLIAQFGCGGCHVIPGIQDAKGVVGPLLTQIRRRVFIAGVLRNTPDNMIIWLRSPQSVVPNNAMPDLGLSDAEARDIAAYLYTLN